MDTERDENQRTFIKATVVLNCTWETWPAIRRAIAALAGDILYMKTAPAGTFLWIEEGRPQYRRRGRDATGPREVS